MSEEIQEIQEISIEIMGKIYQIKCPPDEVDSLHRAAEYLQEKMRAMREIGVLSVERVAVITSLNIVHQLLTVEQNKKDNVEAINQKIQTLNIKIEQALTENAQVELVSAE